MSPSARSLSALLTLLAALGAPSAHAQSDPAPIPADYYPTLGFAILDQAERAQFVELAEAELCPCPGGPRSLSSCLRAVDDRCTLAEDVASLMMRRIKEDASAEDIRDAVVLYITDAQRPREFDLSNAPRRGPADAPIQMVVFSDFECPYCRQLADTLERLHEELGDRLAVYYLHFPLPQHTNALAASRAAVAAGRQGRFWEMHDLLFDNQERLQQANDPDALLLELAREIGLNEASFLADYRSDDSDDQPIADRDAGRTAGVNSTPTCFINGLKYTDEETFDALSAYLATLP